MNTKFTIEFRTLYRTLCVILATLLVTAGLPLFQSGHAAASQFTQRSIQLSDSGASGNSIVPTGVGSGTAVKYRVSFTAINPAASMVIDFCSVNPQVNDTCNTPVGMVATAATLNAAQITGNVYASNGWTVTASAGQVKLADTLASQDIAAGNQVFELSGITNPSATGTFYARIYSYQNRTFGSYVSATNVGTNTPPASGGVVDYGGLALSTVNTVTITAKVQESLTYCVTKAIQTSWSTTNDCSDPVVGLASNYPSLTLGHVVGLGSQVLEPTQVDTATIYSQLSTNALNGAVINMRNSNTTCGGLSADAGATCAIPAVNAGAATASAITAGTAAFGLYVSSSSLGVSGIGTLTPTAAYHNNAHTTIPTDLWYGMDTTTAQGPGAIPNTVAGSVVSTYGSTLATTSAPISRVNLTYVFGATSSLTTPAGIYTANLSMIATGTF